MGVFRKYHKLLGLVKQDFIDKSIQYANNYKGFLCNMQIPLVYLLANDIEGEMAEIGVWYGRTTLMFAKGNQDLKIHCVDTFLGSSEHQEELNGYKFRKDFENNINQAGVASQIAIHEGFSSQVANEFKDESLDLVWIDASHAYEDLCSDIKAWLPKIKRGGIMVGHDFATTPDGGFEELVKAVNEKVRDSSDFSNFDVLCNIWGAQKV